VKYYLKFGKKMSKIGKMPIELPEKTEVKISDNVISVKGPKGELVWQVPKGIKVEQTENVLNVTRSSDTKEVKSLHGLSRNKIFNMVHGVTEGYEKNLEINGVGFKAEVQDKNVVLNIGFSHLVYVPIMDGIEIKVEKNDIKISGIDKETVGEMAARIRSKKKPEPYKGKGIKYKDEIIRRKAGKAAKTAA